MRDVCQRKAGLQEGVGPGLVLCVVPELEHSSSAESVGGRVTD